MVIQEKMKCCRRTTSLGNLVELSIACAEWLALLFYIFLGPTRTLALLSITISMR